MAVDFALYASRVRFQSWLSADSWRLLVGAVLFRFHSNCLASSKMNYSGKMNDQILPE